MTNTTINLTPELYTYLQHHSLREPAILKELRDYTAKLPSAIMQIAPDQGQFMRLLIELIGARKTLEVGTYTGYSSLSVALALPPDGRLVACDVNAEWTGIARQFWEKAQVAHKITLHLAPAAITLSQLRENGEENSYDFAFIDADKVSYDEYYEQCLALIKPNGLIALDNVLRNGRVLNPPAGDLDTLAIDKLNRKISTDERVSISMIPVGDGLTLVRKR